MEEDDLNAVPLQQIDSMTLDTIAAQTNVAESADPRRILTSLELASLAHPEADAFPPRWSTYFKDSRLSGSAFPLDILADQLAALDIWASAPWSTHLKSDHLVPDAATRLDVVAEKSAQLLQDYSIGGHEPDDDEGDEVNRHLKSACDQLALDMALSSRIISSHALDPIPDRIQTDAPQMLGITPNANDLPRIEFGFFAPARLKPKRTTRTSTRSARDANDMSVDTEAARLLLNDWPLGGDPFKLDYRDRYSNDQPVSKVESIVKPAVKAPGLSASQPLPGRTSSNAFASSSKHRIPAIPQLQTRQAPTLAATRSEGPMSYSQGADMQDSQSQSQSQQVYSQIVPGPFGGRPAKPKGKKRVAGF